ncbi:hypothetical protein Ddye_005137 [Dipteronia dyeriana]|uniref:Uncharacterized protein n=1 Tax=Dipteronia dyeriana TaxID=168575 RepID=A0AAD9XFQ8_9ROSI|nr:hypothetical protein Ddye_005137 [Dipteronia dyeriana]
MMEIERSRLPSKSPIRIEPIAKKLQEYMLSSVTLFNHYRRIDDLVSSGRCLVSSGRSSPTVNHPSSPTTISHSNPTATAKRDTFPFSRRIQTMERERDELVRERNGFKVWCKSGFLDVLEVKGRE